jgi:hypothetical protein
MTGAACQPHGTPWARPTFRHYRHSTYQLPQHYWRSGPVQSGRCFTFRTGLAVAPRRDHADRSAVGRHRFHMRLATGQLWAGPADRDGAASVRSILAVVPVERGLVAASRPGQARRLADDLGDQQKPTGCSCRGTDAAGVEGACHIRPPMNGALIFGALTIFLIPRWLRCGCARQCAPIGALAHWHAPSPWCAGALAAHSGALAHWLVIRCPHR